MSKKTKNYPDPRNKKTIKTITISIFDRRYQMPPSAFPEDNALLQLSATRVQETFSKYENAKYVVQVYGSAPAIKGNVDISMTTVGTSFVNEHTLEYALNEFSSKYKVNLNSIEIELCAFTDDETVLNECNKW